MRKRRLTKRFPVFAWLKGVEIKPVKRKKPERRVSAAQVLGIKTRIR